MGDTSTDATPPQAPIAHQCGEESDARNKLVPTAKILCFVLCNPISLAIEFSLFIAWTVFLALASPIVLLIVGRSCLRQIWRMTFQIVLIPFRGLEAVRSASKDYDYAKSHVVDVPEGQSGNMLPFPLKNRYFRELAGWIVGAFDGSVLYPECKKSKRTVPISFSDVPKFELKDFKGERNGGIEFCATPLELSVKDAQSAGLLPAGQIPGVKDITTVRSVRPVVFWSDGTHGSGDAFQCIISLTGGVSPNLYAAEEQFLKVKQLAEEYNADPNHDVKLFIFTAGHSMGAMLASAIALKHRCGSLCLNGLGLGRGVQEGFVGEEGMRWAESNPNAVTWLGEEGDSTSDYATSSVYRRQPGRVFRFASNQGHFGYRDMLQFHEIVWPAPEEKSATA
ncbi:MAG: hypothetical protein LBF24_03780 [Puniceicoccales bacterium]|jgi:hypothetical protein|nr:hypothetical protein [Puniceicoccales bacterium]